MTAAQVVTATGLDSRVISGDPLTVVAATVEGVVTAAARSRFTETSTIGVGWYSTERKLTS